jgi:DNA-binding winged helix-turn-helix (wHTH) protein
MPPILTDESPGISSETAAFLGAGIPDRQRGKIAAVPGHFMFMRIGACEIDCDRRRIVRDGAERPLPPKAFDLLVTLIEHRPKVVRKDALIEKIWTETFVSDANLAILIGDVRAALGDSARKPRLIKTHHRVGYSFIGEVTEVAMRPSADHQPAFILAAGKRRILLFEGRMTVGREGTSDIVFDHPSVSRDHAQLMVGIDTLTVEDAGSKNGTRVDGVKLTEPVVVRPGQRLAFGTIETIVLDPKSIAGSTLTAPDE